jgi:hypothetical protein
MAVGEKLCCRVITMQGGVPSEPDPMGVFQEENQDGTDSSLGLSFVAGSVVSLEMGCLESYPIYQEATHEHGVWMEVLLELN